MEYCFRMAILFFTIFFLLLYTAKSTISSILIFFLSDIYILINVTEISPCIQYEYFLCRNLGKNNSITVIYKCLQHHLMNKFRKCRKLLNAHTLNIHHMKSVYINFAYNIHMLIKIFRSLNFTTQLLH